MGVRSSGGGLFFDAGINIDRLKAELQKGVNEVDRFTRQVQGQGTKLQGAFNQGSEGAKLFNAGLGAIHSNLGILGGTAAGVGMVTLLTRQLMGLAKQAKEFSATFEVAMKEVATISQAVRDDFEGVSKAIVDMAANGPDDAIALSKAYYQIVSAGYDGEKGLRLLEVASRAATAGITDTITAADGVTTVMNAWGKSIGEAEKVADVMFKTVEKGKTTFPELASNIAQVAPVASSLKIPFEEIMALIASITKQGTPTAQAFTQIRAALVGLAKEYGETIFQGRTLQETFEAVANESGYSIDKLISVVGRIEGANAILATTGQKLNESRSDLEAMTEATGAMTAAYDQMVEAADNKWLIVHNRWNRELKTLGDRLKTASGGLADFINAMLEDKEADVYGPKAQQEISAIEAQLAGVTDKEEKLRLVSERIVEIRNQRKKLAEDERRLEKQQPGWVQRQAESFNAAIGLGASFQQGRIRQVELDILKDHVEINKRVENSLDKLYAELLSEEEKPSQSTVITDKKARTLAVMNEELEALKEKLGTGSIAQDAAIIRQMIALNNEIERYHLNVRKELGGDTSAIIDSGKLVVKQAKLEQTERKEILKVSRQLTDEERERLEAMAQQLDILNKQEELIDDLAKGFSDTSKLLGAMSFAIGELDRDLGELVGRMADIAHNASQLFLAIGAKDPVSAIASGIGLLGNVIGMFRKKDADSINSGLQDINRTLEMQSAILADLSGKDYFTLARKHVDDLNESLQKNLELLRWSTFDKFAKTFPMMGLPYPTLEEVRAMYGDSAATLDWDIDRFIKEWTNGTIQLTQAEENILKELISGRKEILGFLQEQYSSLLGFTSNDVADSILSGIEEGFSLGETYFRLVGTEVRFGIVEGIYQAETELGEFAQGFGDLLRKTFRKNIIDALNDRFLVTFMERFNESMSDGTLDETERQSLESLYVNAVKQAKQMWDNIAPILNDYANQESNETGLAGAIRGITEETGSLIAGQFFAFRELQQRIYLSLNEQLDTANLTLSHLAAIESNTTYNKHLAQMRDDLFEMKNVIKERL